MSTQDFTYYNYLKDVHESGKFFYSIMESFPQGIILTNTENQVVYANPKIAKITGYSRKELLGKPSLQFLHFPDEQKIFEDIIAQRIKGVYENYQLYILRKNGTHFLGFTITSPYKDADGLIIGTINIITEITPKEKEAELQALALGTSKSLNSILILDKFGRIEWINTGFTKLSGYELFEVIDTTGEILRPENNDQFLEKLSEAIRTKKSVVHEYINYNKSGKPYWVAGTITPVLDIHGGVKEIIIIETDITIYKTMDNTGRVPANN
jgi:PAS domain S-box-containing protein